MPAALPKTLILSTSGKKAIAKKLPEIAHGDVRPWRWLHHECQATPWSTWGLSYLKDLDLVPAPYRTHHHRGHSITAVCRTRDMEHHRDRAGGGFEPDYLNYRIKSTGYMGEQLRKIGYPHLVSRGHAIYVDAKAFYPHIPVEEPGQVPRCELYHLKAGIRC